MSAFPNYDSLDDRFEADYIQKIATITHSCTNNELEGIGWIIHQYESKNIVSRPGRAKKIPVVPYGGEIASTGAYTTFNLEKLPQALVGRIYSYLTKLFVLE